MHRRLLGRIGALAGLTRPAIYGHSRRSSETCRCPLAHACVCLRLSAPPRFAVACESALAAFAVDTSRLPRISGSREVYASPTSTSFITRESIDRAFELTATALINDDWQPYDDPSTPRTSDASIRMSFKKESRALSLFITTSPAQANATSVSYTEVALRNDLPFPKDATGSTSIRSGPI